MVLTEYFIKDVTGCYPVVEHASSNVYCKLVGLPTPPFVVPEGPRQVSILTKTILEIVKKD